MKRIYISDLTTNQECKISGIVENIRDKRTMMFLVIKDISGKIQVTIDKVKNPEIADELTKLTLDSFLTVEGICVENKYVKLNGREILPNKVQIESIASHSLFREKKIAENVLRSINELTIVGLTCVQIKINLFLKYKLT